MRGYVYVALTIALTVYGQLVLKWRVASSGTLPADALDKVRFVTALLATPWVLSAFAAAAVAALCWIAAMTQFELSAVYPFVSLSFILVLLLSAALLGENLTLAKVAGVIVIILGVAVGSQSG